MTKPSIQFSVALLLLLLAFCVSGCGETIRGVGRDATRMGRGIKTIFISE